MRGGTDQCGNEIGVRMDNKQIDKTVMITKKNERKSK